MKDIDVVPSLLAVGEHVMNRGAVDLLGGENLAKANAAGKRLMDINPDRYNDPKGINKQSPIKLAGGTTNVGGVNVKDRFPERFKAYDDAFNDRQNNPAYLNYLNKIAGGDKIKADEAYMKSLKEKNFHPGGLQRYQSGTMNAGGIPRLGEPFDKGNTTYSKESMGNMPGLSGVVKNGNSYRQAPGFIPTNTVRTPTGIYPAHYAEGTTNERGIQPPGFIETMRRMLQADDGPVTTPAQNNAPQLGADAPTLDQAKKAYDLRHGLSKIPVQKYAYGGEVKKPRYDPHQAAFEAMNPKPVYAEGYTPTSPRLGGNYLFGDVYRQSGNAAPTPQASAAPEATKPETQVMPTEGIYQDKQPYRLQQFGGSAPYIEGKPVNTLNIDDGTGGKGLVQFADGRGLSPQQMSGLESRIAYNTANRDKYQANADKYYADEARKAQDANLQNLQNLALYGGGTGDMDPVSYIQANRRQKAAAGLLSGAQDYSLGRGELNQKQNVFDASQQQQQFQNKLGLADIGIKTKTAKAEAEKEANKFALDQIKAAPLLHQSQLLEALSAGIKNKVTDTPEYSQLVKLYQMAFGKNPMDDLMAGQQGLQQS